MMNGVDVYDRRAEAAVLGACLLERRLPLEIGSVCELRRQDFFIEGHRKLWEAIVFVAASGDDVDEVSVLACLRAEGTLKAAGGAAYLAGLAAECPAAVDVGKYAQLVTRYAAARRLTDVSKAIAAKGVKLTSETIDDFLEYCSGELIAAQEPLRRNATTTRGLWEFARLFGPEERHDTQKASEFIPTGFYCLDAHSEASGYPVGVLSIIGALPSVGKTAFALDSFLSATASGVPACYASCEDKASKLAYRMVRQVDPEDLRKRKAWVLDLPKLTPSRLRIHLAPLVKDGLRLCFVDHAQRLRPDKRCNGRVEEVESISNELCAVAADLNIALVLLSQLTRGDWNEREVPPIGSLKWAKALAEDARFVLMLGRAEHMLDLNAGERVDYPHPMYVDIAKNSEGPTLRRQVLMFNPSRFSFSEPCYTDRARALSVYGTKEPFR